MPGRKYVLLISPIVEFPNSSWSQFRDYSSQYSPRMNELGDEALRTGVVFYAMNIGGLTADPFARYTPAGENILAKKTGGITVQNSNFFVDGIGWAQEEMKGYYLLSYVPPSNTFKPNSKDKYHRIKVKVKRRLSEVHTRDGFYGGTPPSGDRFVQRSIPLREAVFSPFLYNDLTVRLMSGYASQPKTGYFLRSWMHLDAKDLTFIDEQDGGHAISMELAAVTTDINGQIQDSKIGGFDGYIRNEDLDQFRKEGINFNLYLPVQRPGPYYVRVALKDKASGKIGTAYQFLEIPDLKKRRLALSSIFVLNHKEDVSEFGSERVEQGQYGSDLALQRKERRKSPAVRSYLPGEGFDYMVIAYNAKEKQDPELETQFVLFKDNEEFVRGNINSVMFEGIDGFFGVPITRRLLFEETMDPGKYVLQVTVTDNRAKQKNGTASQAIDFEIQARH